MADYLIQDDTMTVMANHMRRISGTSNPLSGAEIAEIFSRTQGTIKTDGEYLVEAFGYDGIVLKSGTYDTGEVFAMPKYTYTDSAYATDLLELDTWVATSPTTNGYCIVDDMPIHIGLVMKPVDDSMIICIETTEENTEVQIAFHLRESDIIEWGDENIDTLSTSKTYHYHTYTNIGSYIIKIHSSRTGNITTDLGNNDITKSLIKCVYIPSWVGLIWGSPFDNMTNLKIVTFAQGIYFENCSNMFSGCSSLECVIFPSSIIISQNNYSLLNSGVKKIVLPYGITAIPDGCFADCANLSDIIIPKSVTTIGESSFQRTGFTKFVVPESVISIGDSAFAFNENLEELVISKNVTSLGKYIIDGCVNLSKITIEEGITEIGDYAFYNLSSGYVHNLDSITLPSTVLSIGVSAFSDMHYLQELILMSDSVCSLGNNALYNTMIEKAVTNTNYSFAYIYVPDTLVNSYKTATNWSTYASRIKPLSEYTAN